MSLQDLGILSGNIVYPKRPGASIISTKQIINPEQVVSVGKCA